MQPTFAFKQSEKNNEPQKLVINVGEMLIVIVSLMEDDAYGEFRVPTDRLQKFIDGKLGPSGNIMLYDGEDYGPIDIQWHDDILYLITVKIELKFKVTSNFHAALQKYVHCIESLRK
jgi:hypothetical protein